MYKFYEQYLTTLRNNHKYRKLYVARQESEFKLLDFSTNDYLNLSKNKELITQAIENANLYGVGATGSRLLSGNNKLFEEFEAQIAKDKNSEASLIFNSGFQANLSVLSCLLDEKILKNKPIVFFDKLNHASLYNAVFLSKAELIRYKHNDSEHLESLLKKYEKTTNPKFIVSETVFGMDGDIAPLEQLSNLAREYKTFLYLDEAHATGIFGKNGYGLATNLDLTNINYLIMGTFSKAIGGSGGYVASSGIICDFILNKAPGFIYSTAPPPMVVGAAFAAWKMLKNLTSEREYLLNLAENLRAKLIANNFDIGTSNTHIIPIIIGDEAKTMDLQQKLHKKNIVVSCIRPPTVPPNSSRLRIALNLKHKIEDIDYLIENLINLKK